MKGWAFLFFICSVFICSSQAQANTYYIAANGSDTNNGTSKNTAWSHAPGMPNCTGVCATVTPHPGDSIIFRGGDTWHFGNSSASPFTGSTNIYNNDTSGWVIKSTWSGSSGNPIYWGVDKTWYSGSSWSRPIMSGDNPTSRTGVASCTYDESQTQLLVLGGTSYNQIDNLEFTGLCWSGNQANANEHKGLSGYVAWGNSSTNPSFNQLTNLYIHGWSHVTFSCSIYEGPETGDYVDGEPTGNCDGPFGIAGDSHNNTGQGDQIIGLVCDGSDTDGQSLMCVQWAGFDIHNSVFRYNANAVVINNSHVFHDNLIEYINASGDGIEHSNGYEFNAESNSVNVQYNNVVRHMFPNACGEVVQWVTPQTTDYYFNNVVYDTSCTANFFDATGSGGWTDNVFNNTWVYSAASGVTANPPNTTLNWVNNQCVIPGGGTNSSCYSGGGGTLNYLTDLVQPTTTAAGQGYNSSELLAYSPSSSSDSTVGEGTNEQVFCAALSTVATTSSDPLLAAAATACQADTGYACTYNTTNHAVTCPAIMTPVARPTTAAWDIGAYQFIPATLYGDANSDRNVTIDDALLTAQAAVGLPVSPFIAVNAAVDGTGNVNIYDAFLIAEYAADNINAFSAQLSAEAKKLAQRKGG